MEIKNFFSQNFDQKKGRLLYASGEVISSSLDRDLISEGYLVKRIINYTVLPIEEISDEFIKDLKSSIPDMVLFIQKIVQENILIL